MFDVLRFMAGGMVFFGICGLALWRGEWPERAVSLALVIDICVSPFLQLNTSRQPEFAMLPLDLALTGVVIWVALKSDRWWPLFCAAFAALAALTHLAQALELQIGRNVYITAIILWDYLLVLSIAVGIWEVERRRACREGGDVMSFVATVLTMFPEAFPGPLSVSLIGSAWREQNLWRLETVDIRGFSKDKRGFLDDTPAGGGPGQVMRADVIASALDSVERNGRPLICMSARGRPLTQALVKEWAGTPGIIVLCGRFEGVDQRVLDARGFEEVSVGDAILAGGEAAAMLLIEACVRLVPGVLGNTDSTVGESFEDGLLAHPAYTRPRDFEGMAIPEVLLSGDHKKVAAWRSAQREATTKTMRPDLWAANLQAKGEKPEGE